MAGQWDGYEGFGDSFTEQGMGQNYGLGDLGLSDPNTFAELNFPGMPTKAGGKQTGWAQLLQKFLSKGTHHPNQQPEPGGPVQMGGPLQQIQQQFGQQGQPMDMQTIMQMLQMIMGQGGR